MMEVRECSDPQMKAQAETVVDGESHVFLATNPLKRRTSGVMEQMILRCVAYTSLTGH